MTPSARIQATIEILDRLMDGRMPLDTIVGDYMRGRRYIGSKDRAAIANRVYEIIRHKARLEWWIEKQKMPTDIRTFVIASACLLDERKVKDIVKLFDGGQYGADKLDDAEMAFINAVNGNDINHRDMPNHIAFECPEEHMDRLAELYGKDFKAEMQAMMVAAPLDIRVNVGMIDRENALASLQKDNVPADITPYSPWGIRLREKTFLSKTKAFSKGFIDIQDDTILGLDIAFGAFSTLGAGPNVDREWNIILLLNQYHL